MKFSSLLSLACLVAAVPTGALQAQSFGGSADRSEHWDIYAGFRELFSESVDFEGGSTIDTDSDLGFAFGGGYNLDEHLLIGGEFSWNNVDYNGTSKSADTPGLTSSLDGSFDVFSVGASATWHFLPGALTPFVSGALGYTWIDTNIATGPPQVGCWWDPWYGQICNTFVDTKTENSFNYGVGLGLRWDFAPGWFGRVSYDERWLDIGDASGTPSFGSLRVDIGSKF